jgi:hypothetical protein
MRIHVLCLFVCMSCTVGRDLLTMSDSVMIAVDWFRFSMFVSERAVLVIEWNTFVLT